MKRLALLALPALSGCAATTPPPARIAPPPVAPVFSTVGLERVMGQDAAALVALFGNPDAEVREGPGRKLQFGSALCVLDAYLYPRGPGEPKVTHVDARQPDGGPIDRASCVAALARRDGAR